MFKDLRNEAKITFNMKLDSPLSIRSSKEGGIDPTLPDMQCIRTYKNGKYTVFIPGSSIKGVIRSRCEKIINFLGGSTCNIVNRSNACSVGNDNLTGEKVYKKMCPACKMFGSGSLGGRVKFKDAYPLGETKIGQRNGVGINRITGAAQGGVFYDFEVVEDGTFEVVITMTNYELYQLKLLLFVISDINDGYVAFGSGSTRGNGKMKIESLNIIFRDYRKDTKTLTGFYDYDVVEGIGFIREMYYNKGSIENFDDAMNLLHRVDIEKALKGGN